MFILVILYLSIMADEIDQAVENIKQVNDEQVLTFATNPVNDDEFLAFVKASTKLVAQVYDGLAKRHTDSQLASFEHRVSEIPYTRDNKTLSQIVSWTVERKDLIEHVLTTADDLDQSYKTATIGTLISSTLDLLYNIDSLFNNEISDAVAHQAHSISPTLGLISQTFFKFLPYYGYMGLFSSLGDAAYSKIKMLGLKRNLKEDLESFENIKQWLQETETLDSEVKKLFPFGMDNDVLAEVENALSLSDCCTKVFAVALYSNVKKFPFLAKNVKFLCQAFIFSRSEVAEEWYNRILTVDHPIGFEKDKLDFKRELFDLAKSAPEIKFNLTSIAPPRKAKVGNSEVKNGFSHTILLKGEPIAHVVQGLINCFSIYFSFNDLRVGVKNKHSDWLKELARKSKVCLDQMMIVQNRLMEMDGRLMHGKR